MVLSEHKHIPSSQISETIGKLCTFGNDAACPRAVDGQELLPVSAQNELILPKGELHEISPLLATQKGDLITDENAVSEATILDAFQLESCESDPPWQIVRTHVCRSHETGLFKIQRSNKMTLPDARPAADCQILSPTNGGSSLLLGQKIPSPQSGRNPAQQRQLCATQLGILGGNPKNSVRRSTKRQRKNFLKSLLPTRPILCAIPERREICESYF